MSMRPTAAPAAAEPKRMFSMMPDQGESAETAAMEGELTWEKLTETEKSAASLGVDPSSYKPIGFMNAAHYDTLLKANAIDGELAKKLEAFKAVAASSGQSAA